jgi:hypothetical protein
MSWKDVLKIEEFIDEFSAENWSDERFYEEIADYFKEGGRGLGDKWNRFVDKNKTYTGSNILIEIKNANLMDELVTVEHFDQIKEVKNIVDESLDESISEYKIIITGPLANIEEG